MGDVENDLEGLVDAEVAGVEDASPEPRKFPIPDGQGGVKEEGEGEGEQKKEDEGENADAGGEIAPELLQWAAELGYSEEDLKGKSEEAIKTGIELAEGRMRKLVTQKQGESGTAGGDAGGNGASQGKPQEQFPTEIKMFEVPKELRDNTEESVMSVLDGINEHAHKQVEAVQKAAAEKIAALELRLDEADNKDLLRQLNSDVRFVVGDLGKPYKKVFSGANGDANLDKVKEETAIMADAYAAAGRPVNLRTIARRAVLSLFGVEAEKAARNDLSDAIRDSEGKIIARPTNRQAPPRQPVSPKARESRAEQKLKEGLRKLGVGEG